MAFSETTTKAGTVYTYDPRNLKSSEAFPGHNPTSAVGDADYDLVSFTYDAARRLSVKTDQQGDTCTHNYDLAGRRTARDYQGGPLSPLAGQSDSDAFTYDAAGRMTSAASGRYNNVVAFGYDHASRLVSESLTAYGQTYTVGSGFDAAGRKTTITYPDGTLVERAYTPRGQLSEIKYEGTVVDTRTYDPGGRLATSQYGNGVGTTWTYRDDNLLSSITRTNLTGADFTYTYEENKNKTSETISGVMAPYGFDSASYDAEDRLIAWNRSDGNLDQSWDLSNEGDWDTFTENAVTQTRTHSPVHELASIDSTPLLYDAKGNLTTNSNGQTYTWGFHNRLENATVPAGAPGIEGTHSYTYNAIGRRVSKSVSDGGTVTTTVFVCMLSEFQERALGQGLAEYLSGGLPTKAQRTFLYSTYVDEPSVMVDYTGADGTVGDDLYYYHVNNLYSVTALTDATASIAERYAYTAYGKVTFLDANGVAKATQQSDAANPYSFTGRKYDSESELNYFRARYYSHQLGKFLALDPILYKGSKWNLFVAYFVPSGMDPSGLRGPAAPPAPVRPPGRLPRRPPTGGPVNPPNYPNPGGFPMPYPYPTPLPPNQPVEKLTPIPGTEEWEAYARDRWDEYLCDCWNHIPRLPACNSQNPKSDIFNEADRFLRDAQFLGLLPYNVEISAVNCRAVQTLRTPNPICGNAPGGTVHCKGLVRSPHGVWVTNMDIVSVFLCACCNMTTGKESYNVKPFGTPGGQGAPHFPGGNRPPNVDISR